MCGQTRVVNIDLDANTDEELSTEDESELQDISDINCKESEDGLKNYFAKQLISKEVDYCLEKPYNFVDNKSSDFEEKKCSDFVERKSCNSDKLLTDSKTNIKPIKIETKTEESKFWEPMASTSKSELKTDSCDHKFVKNDNQIKLRSVEMKDVSTESRYVYRPKRCTPPKTDVPQSSNSVKVSAPPPSTVSPLVTTSATIPKIWDYICKKCSDSLKSRRDFNEHFIRFHSKQNLPQIYTKVEKSREPTLSAKQTNNVSTNRSKKLTKSTSLPSHPIPTHSSSLSSKVKDNRNKKSKHKHKSKKSKSGHSKHRTVTEGQPPQESEHPLLTTNYRLVQKCKICSFTPLVNSMEEIKKHIINEHHIHYDISLYYSDFLVKMTPKKP